MNKGEPLIRGSSPAKVKPPVAPRTIPPTPSENEGKDRAAPINVTPLPPLSANPFVNSNSLNNNIMKKSGPKVPPMVPPKAPSSSFLSPHPNNNSHNNANTPVNKNNIQPHVVPTRANTNVNINHAKEKERSSTWINPSTKQRAKEDESNTLNKPRIEKRQAPSQASKLTPPVPKGDELTDLKEQLAYYKKIVTIRESEIDAMKSQHQHYKYEAKTDIKEVEKQIEDLTCLLQEKSKECETLKKELKKKNEELSNSYTKQLELEKKLRAIQRESTMTFQDTIEKLRTENSNLKSQLGVSDGQDSKLLSPKEEEILDLQKKLQDLRRSHIRSIRGIANDVPIENRQRNAIVSEIITTEKTYVESLKIIVYGFLNPLKGENLIDNASLRSIFINIEVILQVNETLLSDLLKGDPDPYVDLGGIFLKTVEYLKVYQDYVNQYQKSITTLCKTRRKNKAFNQYIKKCTQNLFEEFQGLSLDSYLIIPIQRIPRYELLLKALLKETPSDHLYYQPLSQAYDRVKTIAVNINETKRIYENDCTVAMLQCGLPDDFPFLLMEKGREFVYESMLQMNRESAKGGVKPYQCFLFSDLLLITTKILNQSEEVQYHCDGYFSLERCSVIDEKPSDDQHSPDPWEHKFRILTPGEGKQLETYHCCAETKMIKDSWIEHLRKYIRMNFSSPKEKKSNRKEGLLVKQGHIVKNWKERWFILDNEVLSYYTNAKSPKPLGEIQLPGYKVDYLPADECNGREYTFKLYHRTKNRGYIMSAKSADECREWKEAIENAAVRVVSLPLT